MMPIIPPFAVAASYQESQFGSGNLYAPGVPSIFESLVSPPSSGVAAETAADDAAEAVGFSDYSAANAVQTITISGDPTGGTFTLLWGDAVTTALAYNATSSQVQTALDQLNSVPAGTGGANEVQTVTITGTPTGGTFTLTYSGQTTTTLAYDAVAADVQTALVALSNVGAGNVTVTGGPGPGSAFVVTFGGTLTDTNVSQMTATPSLTGGTSPSVSIATTTQGSALTPNITVTGSNGGPWTVTFTNLLGDLGVSEIFVVDNNLTGGTDPSIAVAVTTAGTAAFVNQALYNATQQYDPMVNFYDSASGNNFSGV